MRQKNYALFVACCDSVVAVAVAVATVDDVGVETAAESAGADAADSDVAAAAVG
jgi:hypothetical protein